jgi:lantibiotic biosynthesis protein
MLLGADHWIKQTLQLKSGLKFSRDGGYETAYGLLEGMTGIGLALIAALDPDTAPAWDRCLLLS